MTSKFTSADEKIVRIKHTIIGDELVDIAKDLNVPLQRVHDALMTVLFKHYNMDAILIQVVAYSEDEQTEGIE